MLQARDELAKSYQQHPSTTFLEKHDQWLRQKKLLKDLDSENHRCNQENGPCKVVTSQSRPIFRPWATIENNIELPLWFLLTFSIDIFLR